MADTERGSPPKAVLEALRAELRLVVEKAGYVFAQSADPAMNDYGYIIERWAWARIEAAVRSSAKTAAKAQRREIHLVLSRLPPEIRNPAIEAVFGKRGA
jgi:hypothetical protein